PADPNERPPAASRRELISMRETSALTVAGARTSTSISRTAGRRSRIIVTLLSSNRRRNFWGDYSTFTAGVKKDILGFGRIPLLGQGGVAAPINKMRRSLLSGCSRGGLFNVAKPP